MALFPLEEAHFHLNEGGSPKRVVSRPCVCEMCWLRSRRLLDIAPLCVPGWFLQNPSFVHIIFSHLSHCLLNLVPIPYFTTVVIQGFWFNLTCHLLMSMWLNICVLVTVVLPCVVSAEQNLCIYCGRKIWRQSRFSPHLHCDWHWHSNAFYSWVLEMCSICELVMTKKQNKFLFSITQSSYVFVKHSLKRLAAVYFTPSCSLFTWSVMMCVKEHTPVFKWAEWNMTNKWKKLWVFLI